uniref:Uncharacterized protein n=1 Tax=Ditylenchus dipsaci TaxID=166011 RepID=A0A915DC21_9BILA
MKSKISVLHLQTFCPNCSGEPVIIAVLLNILLTLSLWIGVYKTQTDTQSVAFYLLDSRGDFTTGVDCMMACKAVLRSLAVLSFVMLGFALYDFQMVVKVWLTLSCLLVNYVTSAFIFKLGSCWLALLDGPFCCPFSSGSIEKVTEKASDYSEQILRLLTFDAKTVQEPHIACDDDETSEIE